MLSNLDKLYSQAIAEYSREARRLIAKNSLDFDKNEAFHVINSSCGDEFWMKIRTKNDRINEVDFIGEGCEISLASANIVRRMLIEKTNFEAEKILAEILGYFLSEINEAKNLGEFTIFSGVKEFPARINCALLFAKGLRDSNEKGGKK